MIKSYFKIAWRVIKKYKAYSLINVLGLTLGIASCLIIFLVVRNELGYDAFNKKADRIYRVTLNAIDFNPSVSMAIIPAMRTDFPELENTSQVWYRQTGLVKVDQQRYAEKGYIYADEQFPAIFDYQWISGDPKTALAAPNTVVLTESIAKKYFGKSNAMGQVINLDNKHDLKVTGVIEDVPGNTHLPFIFAVSFETVKNDLKGPMSNFYSIMNGAFAYIVVPEHYSISQLQAKIFGFVKKNWGENIAKEARLPLQPLKDIHFDQRYLNNTISPTTSKETYWALAAVAGFIIVIACINFINLATAQGMRRAKEVGIRKVLGSTRSQLIRQFLSETAAMVLLSLLLSLIVTAIFLPQAARWMDLKISLGQLGDPSVMGFLIGVTILVILLAGLYPAFVQSSFQPVESLKSAKSNNFRGMSLLKGLVIVQFAISQILIIGTLVVASQMDFFQNRDMGFNKDAVISFNIPDDKKRETIREQLISNPGVKAVSFSSGAPANSSSFTSFSSIEFGILKDDVTEIKFIDEAYTDMFELKMLAGEKIVKSTKTFNDSIFDGVVNETMVHRLGIKDLRDAIGKQINVNGNWKVRMTGVVKDFQSESKHKKIRPCIILYLPESFYMASVKLQPTDMPKTIERIDKMWSAEFPNEMFQYEFLDDHIATFYKQEQKSYTAFKIFSFIAILIGCLGLYGLVAFAVAQRTKEVGIRKVLGASMGGIVALLSKDFLILVGIAIVVASPIAWYIMNGWLQDFAYRIDIGWWMFLAAGLTGVLIAFVTISFKAIKSAIANPVKSLRTE
jgi:putative ABC transport system permease protein